MLLGAAPVDLASPGAVARRARRRRIDGDDRRRSALLGVGTRALGARRPRGHAARSSARCSAFLWLKAMSTQRGFVEGELDLPRLEGNPGAPAAPAETLARLAAVGRADRGERRCSAVANSLLRGRGLDADSGRSRSRPSPPCCSSSRRSSAPCPPSSYWLARKSVDAGAHALRLARLDRRRLRAHVRQLPH